MALKYGDKVRKLSDTSDQGITLKVEVSRDRAYVFYPLRSTAWWTPLHNLEKIPETTMEDLCIASGVEVLNNVRPGSIACRIAGANIRIPDTPNTRRNLAAWSSGYALAVTRHDNWQQAVGNGDG